MKLMRKQNANELNDTGKKQISFSRKDVRGFPVCNAQRIFEGVNGAFNGGAAIADFNERQIVA